MSDMFRCDGKVHFIILSLQNLYHLYTTQEPLSGRFTPTEVQLDLLVKHLQSVCEFHV